MQNIDQAIKGIQKDLSDAYTSAFTKINAISVESLEVVPIQTGFLELDRNFIFKQGRAELIVLGAGTSHGKSAFMLQLAANVSKKGPVFVFSLEMDERDIKARLTAPRINTPLEDVMSGKIPPEKLSHIKSEFDLMQLYICTNGKRNISYIQNASLEMSKLVGNPLLVVIDYLQLMNGAIKSTRTYEIAAILADIKSLAKQLKCPILIGSQLNRECQKRGKEAQFSKGKANYSPMVADLMDSSSIEHDADIVMFISRQEVYDGTRKGEADLLVAKNRSGKTFSTVMRFIGELCCFVDMERNPLG